MRRWRGVRLWARPTGAAKGPGTLTSDTAVEPSTGWGVTAGAIEVVPNGQEGRAASVSVEVTHGRFLRAGTVIFGCDNFLDEVTPEAVSEARWRQADDPGEVSVFASGGVVR